MRDCQKSKVYHWENKYIPEGQFVKFENIKHIVHYVWENEGLKYPPLVKSLHKNNKNFGTGCRSTLSFPETGASTKTILHEIAHAMTDNIHNNIDMHNEEFVGVYIQLVDKYMKVSGGAPYLWHTATISKVRFNMFAKPSINNVE